MDDFVILSNSKTELWQIRHKIINYLTTLRLSPHPKKNNIFPLTQGTDFMGYRIFPTHRRLRKSNIRLFVKRMKKFQREYKEDIVDLQTVNQSVQSWIGHAGHADTWHLRKKLFKRFVFAK